MRLIVVIPTVDRCDVLARTVAYLSRQTRKPDAVVVSTTEPRFAPAAWQGAVADGRVPGLPFPLAVVFARRGSSAQRNHALDILLGLSPLDNPIEVLREPLSTTDVITFFDDDFLPADDYLEIIEREFTAHPDWHVTSGQVPYDGAHNAGYDFDEGVALLAELRGAPPASLTQEPADQVGGYGCNMSVRAGAIGKRRFDERLPLYAWQEDIDFTSQFRHGGRVMHVPALYGVHLGSKAGRVKGVRFGYSQVANPLYLIRKGTMPALFGTELMLRNIAANVTRSLWPESYVDRRGRLYGNIVALGHALRGRIEPEHILKL